MTIKKSEKPKFQTFEDHGVIILDKGEEGLADCIFCGKESKFFVNKISGQWHCKVCSKSGNIYTFLKEVYMMAATNTDKKKLEELEEYRQLPVQAFQLAGLAYNPIKKTWLFPIENEKSTIINLLIFNQKSTQNKIMGTAGLELGIFKPGGNVKELVNPVYICEGPWDAIALHWLLNKLKKAEGSVLGVPGAAVFKEYWAEKFLKNKEIVICYDNDEAGREGAERVTKLCVGHVERISKINWPQKFKDGYDVNDFISEYGVKTGHKLDCLKQLKSLIQKVIIDEETKSKPEIVPYTGKVIKINEVIKQFKKVIYVDKITEDAIKIVSAIVLSSRLKGDPLWLFLIAPPGGGKTEILRAFEKSIYSCYQSQITAKLLISGYNVKPKEGEDEDPSLVPKLSGKCLIIKDFTTILSMPTMIQEELFGILRDVYDGKIDREFGNRIKRRYDDCYFSIVAGVTPAIKNIRNAELGERFLRLNMITEYKNTKYQIMAAMENIIPPFKEIDELKETIYKFSSREDELEQLMPKEDIEIRNRIRNMVQLVAMLRATVERERFDRERHMVYRPSPEVGTRLAKQLLKLAKCLCVVLDKKVIDEEVMRLVEKVGMDTAEGWGREIVSEIYAERNGVGFTPQTVASLVNKTGLSDSHIRRNLHDLEQLQLIYKVPKPKKKTAEDKIDKYLLTDHVTGLLEESKIDLSKYGRRK